MHEEPERIVRRFAAAGNLVVSGRVTRVVADSAAGDPLRALLARLGAIIDPIPGGADADAAYVYADGDAGARFTAGSADLADGVILIECGSRPAFDPEGAVEEPTRAPFRAYRAPDGRRITVLPPAARRRLGADAADADADARLIWARDHMPACAAQARELTASGVLRGVRVGISMVLEPKTATLALFLAEAGAEVVLYAHADETDPAIARALRRRGFAVHASGEESRQLADARAFLSEGIELLLDDGSHLIRLAALDGIPLTGAAEETTSGLRPLRAMGERLRIPVVAVNDARMKTRFDNRYGTGQSCVFAIADLLDRIERGFAGSTTVVIGFGPVGEGTAQHARALGARVVIVETDPVRALEARHAGYATSTLDDALDASDIVISATGVTATIPVAALRRAARNGRDTVFAVAGGVIDEIELDAALAAGALERAVAPKIDAVTFPASTDAMSDQPIGAAGSVLVLDRGGCINITAAEGNPVQIMDYSFAVQLAAVGLLAAGDVRHPGVHALPSTVDERIAASLVPGPDASGMVGACPDDDWHPARFPTARTPPPAVGPPATSPTMSPAPATEAPA